MFRNLIPNLTIRHQPDIGAFSTHQHTARLLNFHIKGVDFDVLGKYRDQAYPATMAAAMRIRGMPDLRTNLNFTIHYLKRPDLEFIVKIDLDRIFGIKVERIKTTASNKYSHRIE